MLDNRRPTEADISPHHIQLHRLMEQRLTLITLGVESIQRALAFYCTGLGWKVSTASAGDFAIMPLAGGIALALYPRQLLAEDAGLAGSGPGFDGITLAHNVGSVEEVEKVLRSRTGRCTDTDAGRREGVRRILGLLCGPRRSRLGDRLESPFRDGEWGSPSPLTSGRADKPSTPSLLTVPGHKRTAHPASLLERSPTMSSDTPSSTPPHLPTREWIERLSGFTVEHPLRILVSGCMTGTRCGFDGESYEQTLVGKLLALPVVRAVDFCPEDYAFGTPRVLCDIHGGNGFDVLDGRAKVVNELGEDWTEGMVRAAERMLVAARMHRVELAILLDISAACGSQVIYNGARAGQGMHQRGPGVCAALLIRNGIRVISHRDHRTLGHLLHQLSPSIPLDPAARDHHETEWYRAHFNVV